MCKWAFIPQAHRKRREISGDDEKGWCQGKHLGEVARHVQSLQVPLRYFMIAVVIPNFMDEETRLKNVKELAQCDKINKKQSQSMMKV